MKTTLFKIAKLSLICFAIAYSCGRIGLVLHELIGHGVMTYMLGGEVLDVSLTYFGGGWVQFSISPGMKEVAVLLIYMGGILVELMISIMGFLCLEKVRLKQVRFWLLSLSSILLIHSFYYFTTSYFYGYGDGHYFYEKSPEQARKWLSLTFMGLTCAIVFVLSRNYSRYLIKILELSNHLKATMIWMMAVLIAGVLHYTLMNIESSLEKDPVYAEIFTPKYLDEIQREIVKVEQEQGKKLDLHERHLIEKKITPFQIEPILITLMIFVSIMGCFFQVKNKETLSLGELSLVSHIGLIFFSILMMTLFRYLLT